jgi:YidC/Oxa1 family membrane protein insertase
MDHKRNLLIVGLAVISYLLLLAWNNDHAAEPITAATTAAAATPAAPNTSAAAAPSTSDLPTAPNGQAAAQTNSSAAVSTTASLITVTTPLQNLSIDLLGGDIVSVSLPKYPTSIDAPSEPFQLLQQQPSLYVAQSGLVGTNGIDNAQSRPLYQSAQTQYSATEGETQVDLSFTTANNVTVVKRFIISATDYLIRQQFIITNNSGSEWKGNLFGQIKRDNSADPSGKKKGIGQMNNFLGAAMTSPDDPYIKLEFEDVTGEEMPVIMPGGWIAFSQHYFLSAWIPNPNDSNTFSVRKNSEGHYLLGFVGTETAVAPGQATTLESSFWAGPKNQDRLEEIAPNLGLTIDYGTLWFIANPVFHLLSWINSQVNNFGIAIILLTLVIKTLLYPVTAKQFASSAGMKRIQPKVAQLKEKYADDPQKLQMATFELYRKEKVSIFGGCLPALLQMPIFLGIFWVLNESVELRQAPFMLWYRDLSQMDPYFVLPILLGAVYFLQQSLTPMPMTDPMQARMMKFMPVIFSVFFLWFPAGLVLYYLINAVLSIFQQLFFNARYKTSLPQA